MLGYSDENDFPNILCSWSDLLHPNDKQRTLDAFAAHLLDVTGKTPYDIEYQLLKKSGEYAYYRASGETIRDKDGNPIRVAGALVDITNAKEIEKTIIASEERMRQARDAAETANKSKSIFLANISHEIRTPMNSIVGFSELALDDQISSSTEEYLGNITENAKWLLNIINDLLDSSKIEAGKMELEKIPFNLQDVISQCQSTVLPRTVKNDIALHCFSEPLNTKMLLGDPIKLRQALMNLLSNAVKFTRSGTVILTTSVKKATEKCVTLNFEVKDSGIGMNQEQLSNIFEPFMQADGSVTRKYGGTGLGLSITKNIIELMGGALTVESLPGVGSKFSFDLTFEFIDVDDQLRTKKMVLKDIEKPNFNAEVLVCEDNYLNQKLICEHLSRVGISTDVANNGKEGVEAVTERIRKGQKPYDLIFMDICMPVMDGLEATSIILKLSNETPIIALTANVMDSDLDIYKSKGMTNCIGKPFTSQELWKCLLKYIPVVE